MVNSFRSHTKQRGHCNAVGKLVKAPEGCRIVDWADVPYNKETLTFKRAKRKGIDEDGTQDVNDSGHVDHMGRCLSACLPACLLALIAAVAVAVAVAAALAAAVAAAGLLTALHVLVM